VLAEVLVLETTEGVAVVRVAVETVAFSAERWLLLEQPILVLVAVAVYHRGRKLLAPRAVLES
jgi:hypothetical protein